MAKRRKKRSTRRRAVSRKGYKLLPRKTKTLGHNECYAVRLKNGGSVALCNKGTSTKKKMRFVGGIV